MTIISVRLRVEQGADGILPILRGAADRVERAKARSGLASP
jgi:hypothetical protein